MSSKIEISRELSDELAGLFTKGFLDDSMVTAIVDVVRKHEAPAVERQEPVAYQARHSENEPWFFTDKPGYWQWRPLYTSPPAPVAVVHENMHGCKRAILLQDGMRLEAETKLYTAPPELAEVQATIARLTAEVKNLRNTSVKEEVFNIVCKERDQFKSGIEWLKAGQREPVAMPQSDAPNNPVLLYADSYRQMARTGTKTIDIWSIITDLERNIAPLYTSQSAPVSVVLDERAEFVAWVRREWPQAPLSNVRDLLPKNDPRYGEYCDESLQRAWVGWQARARLDKVKEMNK